MLFHTIIHGVEWNPIPSIRWIADAIFLINSVDFIIDWQQLVDMAKKHHLCLRLKTGLQYLNEMFYNLIPPVVMNTVTNLPVSYLEKIEYSCITNNSSNKRIKPYSAFCRHLCYFRRLYGGKEAFPLFTFSRSIQWKLKARNSFDLLYKGILHTVDMLLSRPYRVRAR
jgi:hypothetical protein